MAIRNRLELVKGDITKIKADAIVNAANSSLLGGGGVDGAIHRAGGPQILEDCRKIIAKQGGCITGDAVITSAGKLRARFVIHTVGPVWKGGNNREAEKLSSCYEKSLELALQNNCATVAFPNISTGVYGFPKDKAAGIAVNTVAEFFEKHNQPFKAIFVCFDDENYSLIESEIKKIL